MSANELLSALKAVAEPTRLRMLELLLGWQGPRAGPVHSGERGLCLSDLELLVGLPHALVSHHLRQLKNAGLARSRRVGKMVMYELTTDGALLLDAVRATEATRADA